MDVYGFYTGKCFDAYEYLGAHVEGNGVTFRTFAPNASRVSVIGDFSNWQDIPMNKGCDQNFYECYIENAKEGMKYKYRIYDASGRCVDHCDPYGYGMELRPRNASIIRNLRSYTFHDEKWMKSRSDCKDKPLNIYEMHLGSWKENASDENGWYSYDKIGKILIPYLLENGYNYIEVLPLAEYPSDESWGYQATGFYSPTSRYGDANGLKTLIDQCHQKGIGVLLDFVPVHFAVDGYGLANYDGTALYEYPHTSVGYNEWGSKNFAHSRGEVRSFLQSCANYWMSEFHMDGLRIDAISNILYWQGNPDRGVNGNAVEFIKVMNQGLKERHPTVILAAEDSTTFPNITMPVEQGGLGFDYKWDMGWMNDTLMYFKAHPYDRMRDYHKLTFSMAYFWSEHYLLPLSHDEVVHGKATILQKMNGQYDAKFPQARAFYMYMYAHPGKKLNFMGGELGQLREWDEKREQDWCILKYPIHDAFHQFMKRLNHLYLKNPAFYEGDYTDTGFQWIDCHQEEHCTYAFVRRAKEQTILAVFNFSDKPYEEFSMSIENMTRIRLLLDSNWERYGGDKKVHRESYEAIDGVVTIDMEGFSGKYFVVETE